MKIEQSELISELRALTQVARTEALGFKEYTTTQLNFKPNAESWSVLECLEHLCLYGKFYLPEIEQCITDAGNPKTSHFKSGLLGDYFVNMIRATNKKKLKATRQMDATGSEVSVSTINQFIKQLDWLDNLLKRAESVDMTRVKTAISLSRFIKLRLGDTLRFLVYHNERHILQAKGVLTEAGNRQ